MNNLEASIKLLEIILPTDFVDEKDSPEKRKIVLDCFAEIYLRISSLEQNASEGAVPPTVGDWCPNPPCPPQNP